MKRELKIVHSLEEIPGFSSEEEEAQFWADHTLSPELLARMRHVQEAVLGGFFAERASEEVRAVGK